METPYRPDAKTGLPLEWYIGRLEEADPAEISQRLDIPYVDEHFELTILGEKKPIHFPSCDDDCWNDTQRILFGRYLLEGKKAGHFQTFTTYRDLGNGAIYDKNFNGRCILRLAGTYGFRPAAYCKAMEAMGGIKIDNNTDAYAYELNFMPGLYLRFFLWEGDDEFPAAAQILFSDNFEDGFAAEDRVFVCEYVIGLMKKYI